jgi:hypothetical protein
LRAALALARRPLLAVAIAVAAGAVALFAAGRLESTSSVGLLADPDGARGQATQRLDRAFGAEPVTLVATGPAGAVLEPATLVELLGLEGRIAKVGGVRSVYGPGTFLNQTIVQIERAVGRQVAGVSQRAARGESAAGEQRTGQELLVRFGFVGLPTLRSTAQPQNAPVPLTDGSGTTTIADDTKPSDDSHTGHPPEQPAWDLQLAGQRAWRAAYCPTASARLATFSLRRIVRTWDLTVASLTVSSAAIRAFVAPPAIRSSTSS